MGGGGAVAAVYTESLSRISQCRCLARRGQSFSSRAQRAQDVCALCDGPARKWLYDQLKDSLYFPNSFVLNTGET